MAAIDVHTHAFPDDVAPRAMAKLQEMSGHAPYGDGTISGLIASLDAADIDIAVVCPIATRPGQAQGILKWCKKVRSDRIEPLGSVHPDDRHPGKWIRKFATAGLRGVKLHPHYQDFAADEPRLDEIYAALADQGLLLSPHCGQDFAFPAEDDRASVDRYARVLDRHPTLRVLFTHLGGWRSWDRVEQVLLGREVLLETSFCLGPDQLGPERAAALIRRHGVDRVMFGTDWPWEEQSEQLRLLEALPLTAEEKDAIRCSNAAKLLGY